MSAINTVSGTVASFHSATAMPQALHGISLLGWGRMTTVLAHQFVHRCQVRRENAESGDLVLFDAAAIALRISMEDSGEPPPHVRTSRMGHSLVGLHRQRLSILPPLPVNRSLHPAQRRFGRAYYTGLGVAPGAA